MDASLTIRDILTELDELGCTITVANGTPSVSQPVNRDNLTRFNALLRSLRARREEVLAMFDENAEESAHCGVCSATVFVASPQVQQMCHQMMCPYWRKDCGASPEWMAKERNQERYRRRETKS